VPVSRPPLGGAIRRSDAPGGRVADGMGVVALSRRQAVAIAAAGIAAGASLFMVALSVDDLSRPGYRAALACWVTLPYIFAGVVAWRRRPENRLGRLMVTAGFGTVPNLLVWSDNDFLFTVGVATQFLPPALYLHLFLAFPKGRLSHALDRVIVATAYGAAALTVPALVLGYEAPRSTLTVAELPSAAERLLQIQLAALSACLLAGVVLLVFRRLRPGSVRPAIAWLVDSFSLALLATAALMMAGLFGWSIAEPVRITTFLAMGVAPIVFLAGLLQARLDRTSVTEFLNRVGANPGPYELQRAVAKALRDPTAEVAYWLPEFECYGDADGSRVELPQDPARGMTPIIREHEPVAMLMHDPALADEREPLSSVAIVTGLVIENARLQVQLTARLEELKGSRARLVDAVQQGRQALERDLNDGAQQRLVALSLKLGKLGDDVRNDPELRSRLEEAITDVADSLSELRDLAHGIYPAAVRDHGLAVAIESLTTRASVPVRLSVSDRRWPEKIELTAYYIVAESLTNITKHAHASAAVVELSPDDVGLVVEVNDDGVGGATTEGGTGLRGLADRVEAIGGRLRVDSPPGNGTRVRA
jgi:signal transduction histidine kinase